MKEHPRFAHTVYLDLIIYPTTIDFISLQHVTKVCTIHNAYQIVSPAHLDAYWLQMSRDTAPWHHLEPHSSRMIFRHQCGVSALAGAFTALAIDNMPRYSVVSSIVGAVAADTDAPTPQ